MSLNGEDGSQHSSEYNTRQRLESCTHGIQQLEALRLKHKLLMEQIRRDYPSMTSLIKSLSGDESDPIVAAQNSPLSECSSVPSQISDDSGYDHNNSGSTGFSEPVMDYSTFRKLSLEEHQNLRKNPRPNSSHIVEATLKNLTSQQLPSTSDYSYNSSTWSRLHKRRNPLNSNANRPKSCYGSTTNQQETENGRPVSICGAQLRDSKFLDSNVFAQITPPLLQRKFATTPSATQKLEDPPQTQIKQLPKRQTPVLKPKILSSRSVKLQRAELRTLMSHNPNPPSAVSSPKLTPKLKPKQTPQTPVKSWQQSFGNQQQTKKQSLDSSVLCSNDVPRFALNNKAPSPSMSRVANAVRTLNKNSTHVQKNETSIASYDKWKNIASVAPMQKNQITYSSITNGSTTFPSARKAQMPLVGLATISKPQNFVQPQTYTSSCSLSMGNSFKKPTDQPLIRMRHANDWHTTEKL